MTDKFMSMKNLQFSLHSCVAAMDNAHSDALNGHDKKSMDMVLAAALDFAQKALYPIFEEMDRIPPTLLEGKVQVHPAVRRILKTLGDDGWISAVFPETWDGDNMPATLLHCINFIFAAANYSASAYSGLTIGAARLILTFGSSTLQEIYLPPMLAGKWQGTMALTEPDAGSSLGDLVTMAVPLNQGDYAISGEKVFISAGDHDGVDNVVHLMLARIKGAPPGPKGISLFVVPKLRPDDQGGLVDNDVTVTQVFHKLGYRGTPITGIRLGEKGNCRGYLVGEPHRGLSCMFKMMNSARLEVGMGATAIATAAYHSALDYCRTRKQGRAITDPRDAPQCAIIRHPDVKRMLLFQRAISEGALALILQCGIWEDILTQYPHEKKYHLLLELLTPVAKSFPSEMGIHSVSQSLQCFGGYGYCEDFPVEQHFRDMRIHPIHEGKQEMDACMEKAGGHKALESMARDLADAIVVLEKTTLALGALAMEKGAEVYMADATVYLEMFGNIVIAWQWLAMAATASTALEATSVKKSDMLFYEGKIHVARYYFSHELPKMNALSHILINSDGVTLGMPEGCFTG
jgi:butyryl-CoA dehydrogenase